MLFVVLFWFVFNIVNLLIVGEGTWIFFLRFKRIAKKTYKNIGSLPLSPPAPLCPLVQSFNSWNCLLPLCFLTICLCCCFWILDLFTWDIVGECLGLLSPSSVLHIFPQQLFEFGLVLSVYMISLHTVPNSILYNNYFCFLIQLSAFPGIIIFIF